MLLDLRKGWKAYDDAYQKEENPRRKKILGVMKDHIKWEVLGQPDRILESVSPDAVYYFYGLGAPTEMRGFDEIRAFYQGLADSGANVLQLDIEHLAVADWGISAHGVWHQPYPGSVLLEDGGLVDGDGIDDPDSLYLVSQRMGWFFPFTEDEEPLLLNEIVYFDKMAVGCEKIPEGTVISEPLTEAVFS